MKAEALGKMAKVLSLSCFGKAKKASICKGGE